MERDSNPSDELILVREVLAREVETINTYQTLLGRSEDESVRNFLSHIIDEEKEHVAEALDLIKAMDPVQAAFLQTGHVSRETDIRPAPRQDQQPGNRFMMTVGTLRSDAGSK